MGEISLKRLWVLMVTAFVDMLGYALIFPLLPLYAKEFGADAFVIGLLLASFALAQLLTAPLWGRLSDRLGRRPVIVGGQALSAAAFLLFALASILPRGEAAEATAVGPLLVLLVSRFAQGAGGGTISANQAYVSDAVRPEERAQALGWITACTSAGVMIGPAIGSLSIAWTGHDAAPGLIAAALCAANIVFAWYWLPEAVPREEREGRGGARLQRDVHRERPSIARSLAEVIHRPARPAHVLIWVYTSGMLAFMASVSVFSLYLSDRFGIAKEEIGYFFVATGFVSVVMRAILLGPLVKLLGEVRLMRTGALVLAAGLALAPLAGGPWQFLAVMLALPMGTALLFPSTTSLISRFADPGEAGEIHGVQQAFGGTSRLLAPIWAGAAYQLCPPSAGLVCGGALPYWVSSGIVTLTLVLSLRVRPGEAPEPRQPAADPAGV